MDCSARLTRCTNQVLSVYALRHVLNTGFRKMNKSLVAITVLILALVGTNAFWVYAVVDCGVSGTYLQDSYQNAKSAAFQAMAVIPIASDPSASREAVIAAAVNASSWPTEEPFEKDGFVWVGSIGLKFDPSGRVIEVRPLVQPL